jgi:hypothetical protein
VRLTGSGVGLMLVWCESSVAGGGAVVAAAAAWKNNW